VEIDVKPTDGERCQDFGGAGFPLRTLRSPFAHFAVKGLDRKGREVLATCVKIAFLLTAIWLLALPVCLAESPEDQIDPIFKQLKSEPAPGAAVLVVQNGEVVFERGYGLAHLRSLNKINAHSNFRLASCTKRWPVFECVQGSSPHVALRRDRGFPHHHRTFRGGETHHYRPLQPRRCGAGEMLP
jgi:beta-lactamase family protein